LPELPEVETIRRQLAPHLEGRTLVGVEILDSRWTRPVPPHLVQDGLRGRVVQEVGRAGKYLVWRLTGERFLISHLRMTGALLFDPPVDPPHTRVRFELDDGHRLVYNDPRRFGTGHLLDGPAARDAYLGARLGIEPLTPAFTAEHLRAMARGRTAPVKSFILDQRRIAGVGNIYADEALFRARIHPLRAAGSLKRPQFEALREAIDHALAAGIDAKGATIDDFRHVDGAQGSFQDLFQVHQREGLPCPVCGTAIRKLVVGGRGTYVCEHCQPRPRVARPRSAKPCSEPAGVRSRPAGVGSGSGGEQL
jgi:formamidopyrimidine-DNA glycosylase